MKKMFALLALAGTLLFVSCNNEKKDDKSKVAWEEKIGNTVKEAPATLAAHVCTDACKDGNHLYAHGEEGHTCSEACLKTHTCTEACKDGNHAYAHGEKDHVCASVDCGKM
jgi:uncharacterized lipoprotein NlpE involved in copper resistance